MRIGSRRAQAFQTARAFHHVVVCLYRPGTFHHAAGPSLTHAQYRVPGRPRSGCGGWRAGGSIDPGEVKSG